MTWTVIATKHVDATGWPAEYRSAIDCAKKRLDCGTHTLANRRRGNIIELVEVELKEPVSHRTWFSRAELSRDMEAGK